MFEKVFCSCLEPTMPYFAQNIFSFFKFLYFSDLGFDGDLYVSFDHLAYVYQRKFYSHGNVTEFLNTNYLYQYMSYVLDKYKLKLFSNSPLK